MKNSEGIKKVVKNIERITRTLSPIITILFIISLLFYKNLGNLPLILISILYAIFLTAFIGSYIACKSNQGQEENNNCIKNKYEEASLEDFVIHIHQFILDVLLAFIGNLFGAISNLFTNFGNLTLKFLSNLWMFVVFNYEHIKELFSAMSNIYKATIRAIWNLSVNIISRFMGLILFVTDVKSMILAVAFIALLSADFILLMWTFIGETNSFNIFDVNLDINLLLPSVILITSIIILEFIYRNYKHIYSCKNTGENENDNKNENNIYKEISRFILGAISLFIGIYLYAFYYISNSSCSPLSSQDNYMACTVFINSGKIEYTKLLAILFIIILIFLLIILIIPIIIWIINKVARLLKLETELKIDNILKFEIHQLKISELTISFILISVLILLSMVLGIHYTELVLVTSLTSIGIGIFNIFKIISKNLYICKKLKLYINLTFLTLFLSAIAIIVSNRTSIFSNALTNKESIKSYQESYQLLKPLIGNYGQLIDLYRDTTNVFKLVVRKTNSSGASDTMSVDTLSVYDIDIAKKIVELGPKSIVYKFDIISNLLDQMGGALNIAFFILTFVILYASSRIFHIIVNNFNSKIEESDKLLQEFKIWKNTKKEDKTTENKTNSKNTEKQ